MGEFEPKQFGKYFLLDKLAVGGMAEIYKAKTFGVDGFEKELVIKRILPHCSADKDFISMLIDEAKLSVMLSHANIVQVYDLGKVGDDYFISMEFIHGVNLRDIIYRNRENKQQIPPDIAVYITSEICKGLDYAHRKTDSHHKPLDIVHRDISPQNILLSYEGEVKIVDFGIAKAAMNISHTMAGILKGKIAYMSPEQAMGKSIDKRTDIFSTGILLYEMIAGTKLFTGESQFEVLKKIRTTRIKAETLPDSIPEQLRTILAKALTYNPDERFQNAGDLQIELTKFLYTTYSDFSPRKLASFIHETFVDMLKEEQLSSAKESALEQQTSSMSIGEGAKQMEIVHRDTEAPDTTAGKGKVKIQAVSKIHKKRLNWPIIIGIGVISIVLIFFLLWKKEAPLPPPPIVAKPIPQVPSAPPEENVGTLNIISEPSGAAIMVDGRLTGLITPATVDKLPLNKDQRVTLSKLDYENFEQVINITSSKPQNISVKLNPIVPPRPEGPPPPVEEPKAPTTTEPPKLAEEKTGALSVTSEPAGAKITIDGKATGKKTPSTIGDLKIGSSYNVKLDLDGYQSSVRKKSMKIKNENLFAKLIKQKEETTPPPLPPTETPPPAKPVEEPKVAKSGTGTIKIASKPSGADVFINSEYKGKTPLTASVPAGSTSVLVNKEGMVRFSKQISVEPGQTVNLTNIELEDLYGEVSITTDPPRAQVTFDGQAIPAPTPVTIRKVRRDKQHTITVTLPGHKPWNKTFSMDNASKAFNIALQPQ